MTSGVKASRAGPLVLGAVLLAASGCGSRTGLEVPRDAAAAVEEEAQAPSCGPGSCNGCCDDAGVCQAGDAQASCGEQGRACVACDVHVDEVCNPQPGQPDSRVCWAPCNPRLCMGGCCLPGGVCIASPDDERCGSIGWLCVDCTASGDVCGTVNGQRQCVGP